MHLTTITRPTVTITRPESLSCLRSIARPITRPMPSRPTRFLPADSDLLDVLQICATSDRPPLDYLQRVHGIGADVITFLARQGLVTLSESRVYVTDSGLAELSLSDLP